MGICLSDLDSQFLFGTLHVHRELDSPLGFSKQNDDSVKSEWPHPWLQSRFWKLSSLDEVGLQVSFLNGPLP